MAIGTTTLHKTSQDKESSIVIEFDFTLRHEIAAGATISSATTRVLLNDAISTHLTLASTAVDGTGKKVSVKVTDSTGVVGRTYKISVAATLSTAAVIVESIDCVIVPA